jgi:hypothetical protein
MIQTALRELAASTSPPPIDTVYRRGAQLRRRHQRTVRGGALAVTAMAGLTAAVLVIPDDAPPGVEVAAPTGAPLGSPPPDDTECSGFAEPRSPEDVDDLRLLPAWLPPGEEIEHAWARAELLTRETCPRVPTALTAVNTTTGTVTRSVRVEGPSPMPYARYDGPRFEPIVVRGDEADLVSFPGIAGLLQIRWSETPDRSWLIEGRGLSVEELRRVVDGLEPGDTAIAGWLPPDLHAVYQRQGPPPTERPDEQLWWHAVIGDGGTLSLEVSQDVTGEGGLAHLGAGAREVEVRGHPGIADTNGCTEDCTTFLSWQESPTVDVELSGRGDLDTLLHIAESLEPVAPDDPRIGG